MQRCQKEKRPVLGTCNPGQNADDKEDGELDMVMALTDKIKHSRLGKACARLKADRKGGVYTLTAVMMPAVLGFSALGVDASLWYLDRRELQTVADNASVAAMYVAYDQATQSEIEGAAKADAGKNDFVVGGTNVMKVNHPPLKGAYAGDTKFVEVVTRAPANVHFIGAFFNSPVTIESRAVAGAVSVGEHCIIALDNYANRALRFDGTANVVVDCGAASNSNSDEAMYLGGTVSLTAAAAQAFGDIAISNNATLTSSQPLQALSQRVDDPYAGLSLPPSGTCDFNNLSLNSGTVTLSPGRYCGGMKFNSTNVTFEPGTYIIDSGNFDVVGSSNLVGEDVTFILTSDTPNNIGTVKIAGDASADLVAPSSGDYAGVLFYQDGDVSTSPNKSGIFTGGSDMILEGAIYFPNQEISWTGGSSADPACLQIIGNTVSFSGTGHIGSDSSRCDDLNVKKIAQVRIRVVE
jgi:hypothetical protein